MILPSLLRGARRALLTCALTLTPTLGALPSASAAPPGETVPLPGHLPPILKSAQPVARVQAGETINLALTLPLRNQAALNDLIHRLYDPNDPLYGQYLTPAEFVQRFAPTQADYNAVIAFAQAQGLTVIGTQANRLVVDIAGPASTVERAFGVQVTQYRTLSGG